MPADATIKWASLAALVVQNSGLFVVTRYTRVPNEDGSPLYLSSAVVLVVELCKMLICLSVLSMQGPSSLIEALKQQVWADRKVTARLAVPAGCYAIQNNLGAYCSPTAAL